MPNVSKANNSSLIDKVILLFGRLLGEKKSKKEEKADVPFFHATVVAFKKPFQRLERPALSLIVGAAHERAVAEIERQLPVSEQAIRDGAGNKDVDSANIPIDYVDQIYAVGTAQVDDAIERALKQVNEIKQDLLNSSDSSANADLLCEALDAEIAVAKQSRAGDERTAEQKVMEETKYLNAFRVRNGLTDRSADYSDRAIKTVLWLLFAGMVDWLVTSAVFAQTGDISLLMAPIIGGGVAVVNLALGVCAGLWGVRLMTHKSTWYRSVGVAIMSAIVSAFWALNVHLALVRLGGAAMISNPAMTKPMAAFTCSLFLIVSILTAVFACVKFLGGKYSPVDSYFGYMTADKKQKRAVEDLRTAYGDTYENIKDVFDEVRERINDLRKADEQHVTEAEEARLKMQKVSNDLTWQAGVWTKAVNFLVRKYQDVRRFISESQPKNLSIPIEFTVPALPDLGVHFFDDVLGAAKAQRSKNAAAYDKVLLHLETRRRCEAEGHSFRMREVERDVIANDR